ncbi:SWIM zinc finger domain-containing protein [Planomicrobium sp. MB-3u-38]|uniref:SWIM zinc finger family protein n=1 Tax=Planomicrobium sp. MB-3u-38 TaxID=2058318 RepID=UPI00130464FA|nr:SWIM zinc finger family protein [Planomicrobium sp. MB-3u-38]
MEHLTEDAPNRWHARVAGTRDYEVSVNLTKDGTIVGSYCTCPFESDSLCKHEVAVCLAIREYKEENGSTAEVDVRTQLKALKKAELLEILEELVEKQPAVQLHLMEKFVNPDGMDENKARRIIRKSVSRASRKGFIDWDRTDLALEGVWEVQEFVNGLHLQHDAERIVRLNLITIQECTKILEIADSSSGDISLAIHESLENIDDALAQWPGKLDEATVDQMLELLYPHILFGLERDMTDAADYLMESVLQWNKSGNFSEKFYDFIEKVIGSKEMQNKSYDYEEERFRQCQLTVLQQKGDEEEVEAFYAEHNRYPAIRKVRVQQALAAGEYEKVIRLCEESERLDANLPGLVHEWKELRFAAYEGTGSTEEMIDLSFEFALKGEEEYYVKLRSLVSAEQWPKILEALLAGMKNSPGALPLYLRILIDEKRLEELLDYCRTNVSAIEHLYPHLLADYPHEVNEIYTAYIYRQIERASNRKAYWTACQIIKNFKGTLGAEAAAGLIEELKFMYPKRTALLDELGKIK